VGFTARGGSSPLERTNLFGLQPSLQSGAAAGAPAHADSGSPSSRHVLSRSAWSIASLSVSASLAMAARRSSSLRITSKGSASSPETPPSSSRINRLKNARLNCRRMRSVASR
jgi:hypothetical protein